MSNLTEWYKVHAPPPFRESISWMISPFKFWTATIFLHAHLQVVYYKCVKFHKNPKSRLGGVALTRYMDDGQMDRRTDGWTDGRTNRVIPVYPPPNFVSGGYTKKYLVSSRTYIFKFKKLYICLGGIGSVRPNFTFALGSFALKVGPFALPIKKYFNEHYHMNI